MEMAFENHYVFIDIEACFRFNVFLSDWLDIANRFDPLF